jgi:hypothetical protein
VNHDEAEALRERPENWRIGILYSCRADPRVIVRNRFTIGWTWNFGHPWVFSVLLAFTLFALAPAAWLFFGLGVMSPPILIGATAASVLVLVGIAHRVASGPR